MYIFCMFDSFLSNFQVTNLIPILDVHCNIYIYIHSSELRCYYHRDSRQEFAKVGGIFPILHVAFLLISRKSYRYYDLS